MLLTVLVFLIILTVLVLIHELGHFFVAKKFGIKVEEFGVGLPPRAFGIKKGETVYSINWLPIGGFVKLYGEDLPAPANSLRSSGREALQAGEAGGGKVEVRSEKLEVRDKNRAFYAKPVWQRGLVIIAGVLMNFVLTVLIFSFFYTQGVKTQEPLGFVQIKEVNAGSPAEKAGLQSSDIIVSLNDDPISRGEELIKKTRETLGKPAKLTIKREGEVKVFEVVPRVEFPKNEGPVGIVFNDSKVIEKKYPIYQAPLVATSDAVAFGWLIIATLATTIWQLIVSGTVPEGVAGPVGIAQATGHFVSVGPMAVLSFLALLSLNLAVLNILPIPALDGGRLFFILIEGVFRKKVNPHFERYAHTIGMAVLLVLILLITFRDLTRILSGQPILPIP